MLNSNQDLHRIFMQQRLV